MKRLRTPEARFVGLPDFPFTPKYVEVPSGNGDPLRMAYLDEGSRGGPCVLMLHGEPTWSFLYRKIIPVLARNGVRAVAPDLIGFGRSDKPEDREAYSFEAHVEWVRSFITQLSLSNVTLLCHDWGGLIGLRLVGESPELFARVVATNTFLPTGDDTLPDAFYAWRTFSQSTPVLPVGRIVASACARPVSEEVVAAYDAPFPDETYKAGVREFPMLVPTTSDDPAAPANRRAWQGLSRYERPFLTLFGDSDPITKSAEGTLTERIPGAAGQPHATLPNTAHFSPEDAGEEMAEHLLAFLGVRASG